MVPITGDRGESEHDVTAVLDRNVYTQLTKKKNVAGASSSRHDIYIYTQTERHLPDVGTSYLMTRSDNEWD